VKEYLIGTHFSSDNDVIASVEVFLQGQDKLFCETGIQKLQKRWKLAEIMWKNKLVAIAVLCFFIYEAGNFWNNPHTTTTTVILRPVVWDYPGEPVPEETFTHPPILIIIQSL